MPLRILPAGPPDFLQIVQIENASFARSLLKPVFYPRGQSFESQVASAKDLLKQGQDNSALRILKIADTELNDTIVATARWWIFVGPDVKFIKTELGKRGYVPGRNEDAMDEFQEGLLKSRLRLMGQRPHCCELSSCTQEARTLTTILCCFSIYKDLSTLTTDPLHQRRGAGSILISWGCEVAQEYCVPAFLEAAMEAVPLYKKFGFREVDRFEMNLEKYGKDGTRVMVQMIKSPEDIGCSVAVEDRLYN